MQILDYRCLYSFVCSLEARPLCVPHTSDLTVGDRNRSEIGGRCTPLGRWWARRGDGYGHTAASRRPCSVGFAWNVHPNELSSWVARFQFAIRDAVARQESAEGFALWYTSTIYRPWQHKNGTVLGVSSPFRGMAVMFDTYDNDRRQDNPAVMVIANRATSRHDWDVEHDLHKQTMLSCVFAYRFVHATPLQQVVNVTLVYTDNTRCMSHCRRTASHVSVAQ